MNALVAVRALRQAIKEGNAPWRAYASTSKVSLAKPAGGGSSTVEVKNPDPPGNVFKKTDTKDLGPGGQASKEGAYKNPEYFQYHQLTYAEMDVVMAKHRVPQPSSKTKSS